MTYSNACKRAFHHDYWAYETWKCWCIHKENTSKDSGSTHGWARDTSTREVWVITPERVSRPIETALSKWFCETCREMESMKWIWNIRGYRMLPYLFCRILNEAYFLLGHSVHMMFILRGVFLVNFATAAHCMGDAKGQTRRRYVLNVKRTSVGPIHPPTTHHHWHGAPHLAMKIKTEFKYICPYHTFIFVTSEMLAADWDWPADTSSSFRNPSRYYFLVSLPVHNIMLDYLCFLKLSDCNYVLLMSFLEKEQ